MAAGETRGTAREVCVPRSDLQNGAPAPGNLGLAA